MKKIVMIVMMILATTVVSISIGSAWAEDQGQLQQVAAKTGDDASLQIAAEATKPKTHHFGVGVGSPGGFNFFDMILLGESKRWVIRPIIGGAIGLYGGQLDIGYRLGENHTLMIGGGHYYFEGSESKDKNGQVTKTDSLTFTFVGVSYNWRIWRGIFIEPQLDYGSGHGYDGKKLSPLQFGAQIGYVWSF